MSAATATSNPYYLLRTMRGTTHAAIGGRADSRKEATLCGTTAGTVLKAREGEPGWFRYPVPAKPRDVSCDRCRAAMEAGERPEPKVVPTDHRADIQSAVDRMLGTKVGIKRELEGLQAKLNEGERVLAVASGRYNGHKALVALTDARIFCTQESVLGRGKNEVFALDRISGIECESGLMFGEIVLSGSGISVKIDQIDKHDAQRLVGTARDRMSRPSPASAPAPTPAPAAMPAPADDPAARLARLVALNDAGLLTPEEYAQQRAVIVAAL